jgi:hypothetical protein
VAAGWLIGVMVELAGEPLALRHFYAIGQEDRAKAEWKAIDAAMLIGGIATSPVGGLEPVQTLGELTAHQMKSLGLALGQVRPLGQRWPRRWLPHAPVVSD